MSTDRIYINVLCKTKKLLKRCIIYTICDENVQIMKISTKGRNALRLLVDLTEHGDEDFISFKDVAKRQDISKKYPEQIVSILNKTGILKKQRISGWVSTCEST